eukprot:347075-Chlamydomonas_euryale.AAC.7
MSSMWPTTGRPQLLPQSAEGADLTSPPCRLQVIQVATTIPCRGVDLEATGRLPAYHSRMPMCICWRWDSQHASDV